MCSEVARCFAVGGSLGRALFDPDDPLAEHRALDEARWALDHRDVPGGRLLQEAGNGTQRILSSQ